MSGEVSHQAMFPQPKASHGMARAGHAGAGHAPVLATSCCSLPLLSAGPQPAKKSAERNLLERPTGSAAAATAQLR
jgi:hypothetical protein